MVLQRPRRALDRTSVSRASLSLGRVLARPQGGGASRPRCTRGDVRRGRVGPRSSRGRPCRRPRLDASLVLIDRSSSVLAVAARSTADERQLMRDADGVETHELRVGDAVVGRLRMRPRGGGPSAAVLRIATTMIASEVERLRAPDRASEAAQAHSSPRCCSARSPTAATSSPAPRSSAPTCPRRRGRGRPRAPLRARRRGLARRVLAAAERAARPALPACSRPASTSTWSCSADPGRHDLAARRGRHRAGVARVRPRLHVRARSTRAGRRRDLWTCTARATRRCSPRTSRPATTRGEEGDARLRGHRRLGCSCPR